MSSDDGDCYQSYQLLIRVSISAIVFSTSWSTVDHHTSELLQQQLHNCTIFNLKVTVVRR